MISVSEHIRAFHKGERTGAAALDETTVTNLAQDRARHSRPTVHHPVPKPEIAHRITRDGGVDLDVRVRRWILLVSAHRIIETKSGRRSTCGVAIRKGKDRSASTSRNNRIHASQTEWVNARPVGGHENSRRIVGVIRPLYGAISTV